MSAGNWIALATLAFTVLTAVLSVATAIAWRISRTVTTIETDVKNIGDRLCEHIDDCDGDRKKLNAAVTKLTPSPAQG